MFAKKQPAVETVIGVGSVLRGELKSEATVRIDGTFEGRVRADWVVIGVAGIIRGNIVCRGIIVGGKTEGMIQAGELVDIKSSGEVQGDVHTAKLMVNEGGVLEGRSYMKGTCKTESGSVLPFAADQ